MRNPGAGSTRTVGIRQGTRSACSEIRTSGLVQGETMAASLENPNLNRSLEPSHESDFCRHAGASTLTFRLR